MYCLENYENLDQQKKIERLLVVLCFLDFAIIGYLLINFVPF